MRWQHASTRRGLTERPSDVEDGRGASGLAGGRSVKLAPRNGDTFIWHTGNSGDRRAFLGRRASERITIIILTGGDSRGLETADAVVDILHHQPYTPPRLSTARNLVPIIKEKGVDGAIASTIGCARPSRTRATSRKES